ncbi:stage III sporulation protein SpoIIIAB [Peribacillus sp. SCS-26]|uniref:stage III sporulation protein SpoIIIAB n=1 Tax=Paraperibacillus marinus TaxID=3115295 RepID=UPI0039062306
MLKLIGAGLILSAASWGGFDMARRYTERTRHIRQLRSSLQALEAEIMYSHTPLKDASVKLSRQLPKPVSNLFDSFAVRLGDLGTTARDAWEGSLKEVWPELSLKREEFEILAQFGETLGMHDRASQQKQIHLTLTHLEREEKEAADRQLKYEKMLKSLGFLSGLLLVILLL